LQKITFASAFTIIGVLVIVGILVPAFGTNTSFTLQPLEERTVTLSLKLDDGVSGSFSTVSDDGTGVNFHVTDPYNNTILHYEDVLQRSFSFTAETEGDFQLHFDNSLSAAYRKTISLNYDVTHYIMGLPQEQFLMIVIVAVALIGLMLYAVLMPK
jgi:emp24/gp25L/p24 family/GOLD